MMSSLCKLLLALLLGGASSFRISTHRKKGSEPPQVDGVFAFGAPGCSVPALENARGGPCFPGVRSWTYRGWRVDLTPIATYAAGMVHPYVDGYAIDVDSMEVKHYPCKYNSATYSRPSAGLSEVVAIHNTDYYIQGAQQISDLLYNVSNVGIKESYTMDETMAAQSGAKYGWNLVGSATDPGGDIYVGEQVSHLFQQPETKACIMSFQGTSSAEDWVANVAALRSDFCGFKGVHLGFRDSVRRIVKSEDWQRDIRAKLPTCSKLYVGGHSLGGAQAELFAACVQKAPQEGEKGYEEDYKYIGWTQDR